MSDDTDRTAGLPATYLFQPEWETTPREVKAMLDAKQEGFVLLDCRTEGEYATAKIDGAKLVPMGDVQSRLNELEEYLDEKVVVHCHHGGRSLQVTAFLRQQGFTDVTSMAGGIDLWSIDIDDDVPRY